MSEKRAVFSFSSATLFVSVFILISSILTGSFLLVPPTTYAATTATPPVAAKTTADSATISPLQSTWKIAQDTFFAVFKNTENFRLGLVTNLSAQQEALEKERRAHTQIPLLKAQIETLNKNNKFFKLPTDTLPSPLGIHQWFVALGLTIAKSWILIGIVIAGIVALIYRYIM